MGEVVVLVMVVTVAMVVMVVAVPDASARIAYFWSFECSCGQNSRYLQATAQFRRPRFNFCYRTRQRHVLKRKNAQNSSHSTLISETHIFARFSASEIQKVMGGGLLRVVCFSAKVEKYTYL